jgi:lambda family phage portal protein
VDPDRLSNPYNMFDTRNLRQGVEIDNLGRVRRYHIRESHPIDVPMTPMGANWRAIPSRMRNGRQRVIHAYERERVGQHRGVPLFAPILNNFRMLDRYESNELRSSVVNSLIAAFIETSASSDQLAESFGLSFEEYADKRGQWEGQLEGGGMYQLPPGDRINSFDPNRPNNVFGDFENAVLRQLSTGLNMPYELLAKDYSKTNYSSARAALLEAWRYFTGRRRWLATYWAQPVYELWLEEAVNRGLISAPGFYENRYAYTRTRWVGPGRGWIDPVKEAEAARIRIETGLTTLEDEAAEQGADWEDVLEQQAREEQKRRELGLAPGPTSADIAASAAATGADRDNDTGLQETS